MAPHGGSFHTSTLATDSVPTESTKRGSIVMTPIHRSPPVTPRAESTQSGFPSNPSESEEYRRGQEFLARRSTTPQNFTLRALALGLVIGVVICFSNTYFGLQTGWVSSMSMPSALVGFAVFRSISKLVTLKLPFTPVENVLIQSVAGSVGTMPLGCGFVGVLPAMEYLLHDEEGGNIRMSLASLIIWGVGICFFGVVFAVPLRRQVIIREKLKFPSGTAAAHMIALLHNDEELTELKTASGRVYPRDDIGLRSRYTSFNTAPATPLPSATADSARNDLGISGDLETRTSAESNPSERSSLLTSTIASDADWEFKIRLLTVSFGLSAFYTLMAYFFPILRNLPVFGRGLASNWLWSLNPSPAYVGQGMIMGPETTIHMLMGAIVGWGILSPLAKSRGWAPGPISDWSSGSKGWIVWVSLAIMLADSVFSLVWLVLRQLAYVTASMKRSDEISMWYPWMQTAKSYLSKFGGLFMSRNHMEDGYDPVGSPSSPNPARTRSLPPSNRPHISSALAPEPDCPPSTLIDNRTTAIGLALSLILCIVTVHYLFPGIIPFSISLLSLLFALLLSIMGVRAMGETDLNPVSGISKLSQLMISLFTRNSPHAVVVNLIAGALSESGALQAGDLMQDLKTGHILGAAPNAQFWGQMIGSAVGAVVGAIVYKLYTHVYTIPGGLFEIPTAHVWVFTARLVTGNGLPPMADRFCMIFGILFVATTIARTYATAKGGGKAVWWKRFVPGGIAFAIGMYNIPSFTLARTVGGLLDWYWSRRSASPTRLHPPGSGNSPPSDREVETATDISRKLTDTDSRSVLVVVASGLILGEGLVSIVNLVLASMGVPHF